jgi:putative transposase
MNREYLFGAVHDETVLLNPTRLMIEAHWKAMPTHSDCLELDEFVIMPNHLHGIVIITARSTPRDVGVKHSDERVGGFDQTPYPNASPLPADNRPSSGIKHGTPCPTPPNGTLSGSLGAVLQNFKSNTSRQFNRFTRRRGSNLWQINYHEHIIRNHKELERIREYIRLNPSRWVNDPENPQCLNCSEEGEFE